MSRATFARLTSWWRTRSPLVRASLVGTGVGFAYGLLARFIADNEWFGGVFAVMSLAFFLIVPFVLGVITVRRVDAPSRLFRFFAPWIPMTLVVIAALFLGWEGTICAVMALPLLLLISSAGGMMTYAGQVRSTRTLPILLALPYLVAPIERQVPEPARFGETVTSIDIAAPPSTVWPLIASVDSIRPEEQRPALYLALGFPKPISATLSRPGVGGIRSARFEHRLTFTETVTEWVPDRRLAFTIHANTDSVPSAALDAHVTVGGPHFDVMTGTYELHPIADGRGTRLVLRSTHRLSTRVNPYAAWWVERVMASIQRHISEVHKGRAERLQRQAENGRNAGFKGRRIMRQLTVFNQVTLDGYFAGPNGDISWAHQNSNDAEWKAFTAENAKGGGELVFGRITYEMMASYWPTPAAAKDNPVVAAQMNELPKVVFSRTLDKASWSNTKLVKGDVAAEIGRMKKEPGKDMVIFGSGTIVSQLAQAGLVDEFQIVVIPVVLGKGRTMFEGVKEKLTLKPTKTRTFGNGNVLMSYQPKA